MFGLFKGTNQTLGGYFWGFSWRLKKHQKRGLRLRMQQVDKNIENLYKGLELKGLKTKRVTDLYFNLPKEKDMNPKDKYTHFNKNSKGYRKGVHRFPHFTKITLRVNPKNF